MDGLRPCGGEGWVMLATLNPASPTFMAAIGQAALGQDRDTKFWPLGRQADGWHMLPGIRIPSLPMSTVFVPGKSWQTTSAHENMLAWKIAQVAIAGYLWWSPSTNINYVKGFCPKRLMSQGFLSQGQKKHSALMSPVFIGKVRTLNVVASPSEFAMKMWW